MTTCFRQADSGRHKDFRGGFSGKRSGGVRKPDYRVEFDRRALSEQISRNGMNLIHVEDFTIYEGGIGGNRGEHTVVGSAALNLMGIRIPASLNIKNAILPR